MRILLKTLGNQEKVVKVNPTDNVSSLKDLAKQKFQIDANVPIELNHKGKLQSNQIISDILKDGDTVVIMKLPQVKPVIHQQPKDYKAEIEQENQLIIKSLSTLGFSDAEIQKEVVQKKQNISVAIENLFRSNRRGMIQEDTNDNFKILLQQKEIQDIIFKLIKDQTIENKLEKIQMQQPQLAKFLLENQFVLEQSVGSKQYETSNYYD